MLFVWNSLINRGIRKGDYKQGIKLSLKFHRIDFYFNIKDSIDTINKIFQELRYEIDNYIRIDDDTRHHPIFYLHVNNIIKILTSNKTFEIHSK
jgi:hypothetical protein